MDSMPEPVAAILLAAGESLRMGTPKPLLPWLGVPLVVYQVRQLQLAGAAPVVVVLGHKAARVTDALSGIDQLLLVENSDYRQGKSTSIRVGARAIPDSARALVIHAVDQPRRASTLRRLISAHLEGGTPVTMPTYRGTRGHPPVLSTSILPELAFLSEERQGLREIMLRYRIQTRELELEAPELLINLNTPADYRRALALFQDTEPDLQ